MSTPIRFTSPVEIQAAAGKPKRFTTTAYTGTALHVAGYSLPIVVDLAGLTTRKSVTANLHHEPKQMVGHVDDVQNNGQQLVLGGVVSAANQAATEFIEAAKNGYPWQASIEATPSSIQEVRKGESIEANGRTFNGPVYVARKSVLSAVAFVPNGADDSTSVSIAAKHKGPKSMSQTFDQFISDMLPTVNVGDLTESQLAGLHANYQGRTDTNDSDFQAIAPMIVASAPSDPVQAEHRRIRQIENACRGEWNDETEQVTELKARAIGGELSVDDLLQEMRQIRMNQALNSIPAGHTVRAPRHDMNGAVIEAAFCLSAGLEKPEQHYSEQVLDAADRIRNEVSMSQIIMAEAARNGYRCRPGETISQGNLRAVLAYAFPPIQAGGFSTVSLPSTFANIANKFSREGWDSVDQTALRICAIKPVKNFKTTTTISLLGDVTFEQLSPNSDISHGTMREEVYNNKADTYARMFAIDRHDLINDDADVLSAVPRKIGRGAMLRLNRLVWTLFLDNDTFFTTERGNLVDSDTLDLGTLADGEKAFINQTDATGEPVGVMPAILLVPPTLKATALTLMNSQLTIAGSGTPAMPNANVWQGRFSVECSPYMEMESYTGSSSTAFYLLANPKQLPVIEIAALNGNVMPTVESAEVDFSQLGIQVRGYADVGVALQEYRGGVKVDDIPT